MTEEQEVNVVYVAKKRNALLQWLRSNWVVLLIVLLVAGFFVMESRATMNDISTLNNVLNDKIEEITELQTTISDLQEEISDLNDQLSNVQTEMEEKNKIYWYKINELKTKSKNLTSDELVNEWRKSWPGGNE
jgi:peptidoglycan hydrolase CwlO-like protein